MNHAVKQCYQTGQFNSTKIGKKIAKIETFECDILRIFKQISEAERQKHLFSRFVHERFQSCFQFEIVIIVQV